MSDPIKSVPLTCHGHTRPITKIEFSSMFEDGEYSLISSSKDQNPQLRDGITGDWSGTFLGHKGAVWDAQMSVDTKLAATASADFTAKVWDTMTGECIHTIHHNHIVRGVAFPRAENPCVLATVGYEKKLRIYDLNALANGTAPINPTVPHENGVFPFNLAPAQQKEKEVQGCYELGTGQHGGIIKSVLWNIDHNVITTACEDKKIRWVDLRANVPVITKELPAEPSSMKLNTYNSSNIITVTAGKMVYLYNGAHHGMLQDQVNMNHEVVSAALDTKNETLVTGSASDTWVHFYDMVQRRETSALKGHHGPVWTIDYSPDGKIIGTGSEDGTIKLWKACKEPYGLWKN